MSLQQQTIKPAHIVDAFQKDNQFFIKLFLLDDTVNRNQWGIKQEYLSKNINKFRGVPLLLTPDIWHPHEFEHYKEDPITPNKNIEEYRRLQKPYEIGNIVEIGTNLKQGSLNHEYSALVEITNEKAIQSFKENKIPLFVSPSIYRINPKDPNNAIGEWEPIHVAIVDNPAFGTHKANIRAHCQGNLVKCSRMLAQAGSVSSSDGLGYCVTTTLNNVKNVFQGSLKLPSGLSVIDRGHIADKKEYKDLISNIGNSSFTNKLNISNSKIMEEQSNNQVSDQVTVTTTLPDGKQVVEQKQEQKPETVVRSPINPPNSPIPEPKNINPPGSEEQREEGEDSEEVKLKAKQYDAKLAELESKINKLNEFQSNLEKKSQETAVIAKRSKIEGKVPRDFADSNEAREEAISKFMNVPDAELDYILDHFVVPPCQKGVKQAGYRAPRVSDFIVDKKETNIKQAGTSTQDIEMLNTLLEFGGYSS